MRLATWNINSVRARTQRLATWIKNHQPDVMCLQETKCTDEDFPFELLAEFGYESAHFGFDHWNGVAICSRIGIEAVQRGFSGPTGNFGEARLLSATCAGVRVMSVYVPNGRDLDDPHYLYKLVWLERLRGEILREHGAHRSLVVAGDFNVAPADIDIYDPRRWKRRTHASPAERQAIVELTELGLVDVHRRQEPGPGHYTWWSYRPGQFEKNRGLRIDLVLASEALASQVVEVAVDTAERSEQKPSDHAPVVVDFSSAGGKAAIC